MSLSDRTGYESSIKKQSVIRFRLSLLHLGMAWKCAFDRTRKQACRNPNGEIRKLLGLRESGFSHWDEDLSRLTARSFMMLSPCFSIFFSCQEFGMVRVSRLA